MSALDRLAPSSTPNQELSRLPESPQKSTGCFGKTIHWFRAEDASRVCFYVRTILAVALAVSAVATIVLIPVICLAMREWRVQENTKKSEKSNSQNIQSLIPILTPAQKEEQALFKLGMSNVNYRAIRDQIQLAVQQIITPNGINIPIADFVMQYLWEPKIFRSVSAISQKINTFAFADSFVAFDAVRNYGESAIEVTVVQDRGETPRTGYFNYHLSEGYFKGKNCFLRQRITHDHNNKKIRECWTLYIRAKHTYTEKNYIQLSMDLIEPTVDNPFWDWSLANLCEGINGRVIGRSCNYVFKDQAELEKYCKDEDCPFPMEDMVMVETFDSRVIGKTPDFKQRAMFIENLLANPKYKKEFAS